MSDSTNERAGALMGRRRTGVIAIDQPCEIGFHCPVCVHPIGVDGDFDERLTWSEYEGFLWCEVCETDFPSALCMPDIEQAVQVFLDTVEDAVERAAGVRP